MWASQLKTKMKTKQFVIFNFGKILTTYYIRCIQVLDTSEETQGYWEGPGDFNKEQSGATYIRKSWKGSFQNSIRFSKLIRMLNECLCTKTGPLNRISYSKCIFELYKDPLFFRAYAYVFQVPF